MSQTNDKVKFYSNYDLSLGTNIAMAETVLLSFDENKIFDDVNEVLAWHNTKLCFDSGRKLTAWTDCEYETYLSIAEKIPPVVNRFFGTIDDTTFQRYCISVDSLYYSDFWRLVDHCKVYKKITEDTFSQIINNDHVPMWCILSQKNLVIHFGNVIADKLKEDAQHAELVLQPHIKSSGISEVSYYFPKELTLNQRETLINSYIQTEDPNLNLLDIIVNLKNTNELRIDDRTRLAAKRKYDQFTKNYFENNIGVSYGVEIAFSKTQTEEVISNYKPSERVLSLSYGLNWLEENKDFPTLLNNFIHLFAYVDRDFRSCFPVRPSDATDFFSSLFLAGKDSYYNRNTGYQLSHMMFTGQMHQYYKWLTESNIQLENIFKWFFEEYLVTEFNVKGFFLSLSHKESTYAEKCKSLVIEIERVLKQFRIYVNEGHVDSELLDISSVSVRFEDIPSFCSKKYIYPLGIDCHRSMNLLFSNQSTLKYRDAAGKGWENFAQAVIHNVVNKSDLLNYQRQDFDYLINQGFIRVNENEHIIANIEQIEFLSDLYYNQVASMSYMGNCIELIQSFESNGLIQIESSLFTRPEQEYMDYMMNNSKYTNSQGLRNKYCHGAYPSSEEDNKADYMEILKIMVLIIIKINEEFCLRDLETNVI